MTRASEKNIAEPTAQSGHGGRKGWDDGIMRGYAIVGLHNPKDEKNIGSVMRAAGVYGARLLAIQGSRFAWSRTDTGKFYKHIPVISTKDLSDVIPYDCRPVAVDIIGGAVPLPNYNHPERAFYVFGAEDETLGENVLRWCKDVVYIPTNRCMNLAATVNVVLYDRLCKHRRHKGGVI